jgi:uncharacterized protein
LKSFIAIKYFSDAYRQARLFSTGDMARGATQPPSGGEALRQAHLEYLQKLKELGTLFCGGPVTDWSFALDIYRVESREEVQRLLDGDPYFQEGIFSRCEIKEWRQTF